MLRLWTTSAPTRSIRSNWSWPSKRPSKSKFPTRTRRRSAPCKTPSPTSTSTRKARSSFEPRVVGPGIGLICAVGNNAEEVWQTLLAGKSGVERITSFDASAFACQIAAEVKGFDPLQFLDKKEARKMARFIHLALAASDEALRMANYKVDSEELAERTGVNIGSGIGGFDIIEREHSNLLYGGPGKKS